MRLGEHVLIEVKDHCGGLPPGSADDMFSPFTQRGNDRSGLGLGLSIARQSIEADYRHVERAGRAGNRMRVHDQSSEIPSPVAVNDKGNLERRVPGAVLNALQWGDRPV
jgi:hypothetical protein